jgi:hypothetical protein
MMSIALKRWLLIAVCLAAAVCLWCNHAEGSETALQPVAKIGEYTITADELEKRLTAELSPYNSDGFLYESDPPTAKTVLAKMVAEKAMIMDARKQDLLKNESVRSSIKQYRDRQLVDKLLNGYLQQHLQISEAEIQEKIKGNAKLDYKQAKQLVQGAKSQQILDAYYKQIWEKFKAVKLADNFPKAAQIHQRLLYQPKTPRDVAFIRDSQLTTDMTDEERNLVLATFTGGKVTLRDWFEALCEIAPPHRPDDLSKFVGVDRLLDRALRAPLLVAEAESLGLDKDEALQKKVKDYEDMRLLGEIKMLKYNEVVRPNDQQTRQYFDQNKQMFRLRKLKLDQIWCQNIAAAKEVKSLLDKGEDFDAVKKKYSIDKQSGTVETFPDGEGVFWKQIWASEPNQIVGPIKGFYQDGFKWRLVKMLAKDPGEEPKFDEEMANRVKWRIIDDKRLAILAQYEKELLAKYPHETFEDKTKTIDPLSAP